MPFQTTSTDPALALATLPDRDGIHDRRRTFQPRRHSLDSDVRIEIPSPHRLAEVWALPALEAHSGIFRTTSRTDSPMYSRGAPDATPTAITAPELRALLEESLAALPARPDARKPYNDLRLFLAEASPVLTSRYLRDLLACVRRTLPVRRLPSDRSERGGRRNPPMTPTERSRASRAAQRDLEAAASRGWLNAPDDRDWQPGSRLLAADLYAEACEELAEYAEEGDSLYYLTTEDADRVRPVRVPRRAVFYAVADELLGARIHGERGGYYVAPQLG